MRYFHSIKENDKNCHRELQRTAGRGSRDRGRQVPELKDSGSLPFLGEFLGEYTPTPNPGI
jgi:hypothetical protein